MSTGKCLSLGSRRNRRTRLQVAKFVFDGPTEFDYQATARGRKLPRRDDIALRWALPPAGFTFGYLRGQSGSGLVTPRLSAPGALSSAVMTPKDRYNG